MSYLEGCAAYEQMFEYRKTVFGEGNRHTVMMAKKFAAHLLLFPQCHYRGRDVLDTLRESFTKLKHADKFVIDERYRAREITPLIMKCHQMFAAYKYNK
jgi:hypothetical protein